MVKLDEARAYVFIDTSLCSVCMAGVACWRLYAGHSHCKENSRMLFPMRECVLVYVYMRVWTWNSCEYTHSLWSLHELEYFKRVCMHTYALFRAFEPSEWACNIMHICVCIYLCMYTRPLSLRFDMHVLQELVYVCKPPSPSSIQSAHVCVCVCVCVLSIYKPALAKTKVRAHKNLGVCLHPVCISAGLYWELLRAAFDCTLRTCVCVSADLYAMAAWRRHLYVHQ